MVLLLLARRSSACLPLIVFSIFNTALIGSLKQRQNGVAESFNPQVL
jgi:hypothetical protein